MTYPDAIDTNSSQMVPSAQSKLDIALSLEKIRRRDAARPEAPIMHLSHDWTGSCDCDPQPKPQKKISCYSCIIVTYSDAIDTHGSQMGPRAESKLDIALGALH